MAKRAEIAGQGLIILDATGVADRYGTNERVRDAGGRVLHRFGSRVLIGDVPARVTRKASATTGLRSAHAGVVAKPPGRLTEVEAMGVAAWNLRMSAAYAQAKEQRPHDGVPWDAAPGGGPIPPDGPGMTHVADATMPGALSLTVPEDMSTYLIGSVAVGIVMVDGPTPDLQFSPDERTKVVAEVQEGLTWMAHVDARAGVSYSYDIRNVQIDRAPDPTKSGYEPLESHWRDPAMIKLGFAGNMLGVTEYVKTIRRNLGTKWGYVGLFTKYPTEHFAYALKPRLVMQYSNDGWGPDNIDRVFTHESGHIFGCPDEYASSGCDCTTKFGYLREPNRNCQNCATPFVDCLMAGNTFAMCPSTPIHLGWRDSDGDGALDPVDPVGNPSPVIDLGKICSFVPFICQLVGLGQTAPPAGAAGFAAPTGPLAAPAPDSVPVELLRQVLTDDEMARVERAIRSEELAYLEALERKLRAAVRDIARERKRGVSSSESDRHLLVAQLIGGATSVWVGVVDAPVVGLRLDIGGVPAVIPDAWESFTGGGRTLRSQRVPVTGRPPRSSVPILLLDGAGQVLATTTLTTMPGALPSPVERPFTILFGSCFAGARDTPGDAGATFARLPPDARPDLTVLCGDQVYLDTPLLHWLTRTHPPEEFAAEFLANYLGTWTQAGPLSGFRRIHQLASVAFTSDDHDYWNNAPSIAPHVIDTWTEHGRTAWLDVAHRLYRQIETTTPFQSIRVGPLSVFIADTRIARTGDRLSFMDGTQFEALRAWVHGLPGPGALVLGQPIFSAEAGLKGYIADWGLPDFHQYRDLVALLASTPHDIAILTGDVHFGRVASCTLPGGRRIVELIASPLALVDGLVGGNWKPAPAMYPTVPVPAVPQVAVTTEPYQETRNHAMTVGFTGVGASVRLTATSWPIQPCQPAVGTVVHTTELH